MAAETRIEHTDPSANAMDYAEHDSTYSLFLWLAKWVTISAAIVLIGMAMFLTGPSRHPAPPPTTPAAGQTAH